MFMAEGAVRLPSGRLTPAAAHKRSDNVCCESGLSDISRVLRLLLKTSIKGFPPSLLGAGSVMS
jgi:hypothetical protein